MDIVNSRCTDKDDQKHERLRKDWVSLAAILSRSLWFYQLNAEINSKCEGVNSKLKHNAKTIVKVFLGKYNNTRIVYHLIYIFKVFFGITINN